MITETITEETKVILPFRGEFGFKCYFHAPVVHAIPGPKVVMIEPGSEALYPSADEWIEVPRRADELRRATYRRDAGFVDEIEARVREAAPGAVFLRPDNEWPKERFAPRPHVPQGVEDVDIVICPRYRKYGASKNWEAWPEVAERLVAAGLQVFAAGAEESSYPMPDEVDVAWNYDRDIDSTIEAMHRAKLVLATDAGLAHLAVLCGRPLLLIAHDEGLIAPGPSADETGRIMDEQYWPIKMHRYEEANHRKVPIGVVNHGWENPDRVLSRALEWAR